MQPFFTKELKSISQITGQDEAVQTIQNFFSNFKKGQTLFLYGPTGTGKTSSIQAFAKENNFELLELNASDTRNQKGLTEFLSKATGQMSLFATKKIVLLDEVDGLSGMKDRGAVSAIVKAVQSSPFPIVCTGVDVFDKKFSALKKIATLAEFTSVNPTDITSILKQTLDEANLSCSEEDLKLIARNAAGDVRAALNDLFTFIITKEATTDELEVRRQTQELGNALIKVFKSTDPKVVFGSYDLVNEDLDKIFLWVDENLPREYTKSHDLSAAFNVLAKANIFFGRIRRWQYYRFYVYCYALLSVGIAVSKDEKYPSKPSYRQPTRLLKYWQANMTYAKRKAIVEKIATAQNTSKKVALQDSFHLLLPALIGNKELRDEFDIDGEELAWLQKRYGSKI